MFIRLDVIDREVASTPIHDVVSDRVAASSIRRAADGDHTDEASAEALRGGLVFFFFFLS